ncbi:MAG: 50S ribosomal protein L5 [Bacillota bacterium]|jgi:large subunit ribosomal protein L5|nr:MAG: 50S ribosomal protein L5 [Planctomycetota bacterium]RUA10544.1 MAG: 50S ribosomal protein L5 [Bacillota bacterium]
MSRLKTKYEQEILPQLSEKFGIDNAMRLPRLRKIVVNRGIGKALENKKRIQAATEELALITGQKPVPTRAKKSVANFHLREGNAIGCKVTLRGVRMYEFLDRLISVVLPRVRDFRGVSSTAFDGRGNFSMGLTDQLVFPELRIDDVEFLQGMNICITTSNSDDEKSLFLLSQFGFPFRKK